MTDQFDIRNPAFGLHPVLANPPFNPAERGTNFAWVQHFIHHFAPHGMAGFALEPAVFWWNIRMPHGRMTRGDRPRWVRAQRNAWDRAS